LLRRVLLEGGRDEEDEDEAVDTDEDEAARRLLDRLPTGGVFSF
jgi:hypothetical protein